MKHLVNLSDLAPRQHEEVADLLRKHGVAFRETPSGVFAGGAILVADADFPKAISVLREESREFAKEARESWDRSWRSEHGSSTARWFFHGLRTRPGSTVAQLLLLILMVAIFVIYPVWYVVRAAI